jgi:hypothetical protein
MHDETDVESATMRLAVLIVNMIEMESEKEQGSGRG